MLKISSGEVILEKPRRQKNLYRQYVKSAIKRIKADEIENLARGKKKFPNDERILFQKMDSKVLFAAITSDLKRDSAVYRFFKDFYVEFVNTKGVISNNEDLERWLSTEIEKFNKGLRFQESDIRNSQVTGYRANFESVLMDSTVIEQPSDNNLSNIQENNVQQREKDEPFWLSNGNIQTLIFMLLGILIVLFWIFFLKKLFNEKEITGLK